MRALCLLSVLALSILAYGCATPPQTSTPDRSAGGMELSWHALHHANGQIAARGRGLSGPSLFNYESASPECRRSLECATAHDDSMMAVPQRSGPWHYWYPTGQLRASLEFRLGTEVYCGVVPFTTTYEVKEGAFEFYHPNGSLRATGAFVGAETESDNMCGPVTLEAGRVPLSTVFFNALGTAITDSLERAELREEVNRW